MIYQCFYKRIQASRLFKTECYKPFGLEPNLNQSLFKNCPELECENNRESLNEYACFLWFFRNQDMLDSHFGSTSFRQLSKSKRVFKNMGNLKKRCGESNIVTWNLSRNTDSSDHPIPVSLATEAHHPHMSSYIRHIFKKLGYQVPPRWYSDTDCIYANYWYLSKSLFIDFMEYSLPVIELALEDFKNFSHAFFTKGEDIHNPSNRRVGYLAERIFIIWYYHRSLDVVNLNLNGIHTWKTNEFNYYR